MAGYSNNMTLLVNKIERRLGTMPLNLPDNLKKEIWGSEVIEQDTLVTFSRYYPHKIRLLIDQSYPQKNGWYYLDEDLLGPNVKILGIKDLDFESFGRDSLALQQNAGYGIYDFLTQNYGIDDIGLLQMRADHMSLFNNGIYVDFQPPNRFRLVSASGGNLGKAFGNFPIYVFLEHSPSLTTISATQMETFESLAQADVARFLYENLKYYDKLETVYASIDIKMDELLEEANKREEVINYIKDSYVSASNANQPLMMCL